MRVCGAKPQLSVWGGDDRRTESSEADRNGVAVLRGVEVAPHHSRKALHVMCVLYQQKAINSCVSCAVCRVPCAVCGVKRRLGEGGSTRTPPPFLVVLNIFSFP
jgi:hypothetical protein